MRILLSLSLLTLIASAVWAPLRFRAREPAVDVSRLFVDSPTERAAQAEKDSALGRAILAYEETLKEYPNDRAALRGLFLATMRLGAAVPRQPDIVGVLDPAARRYLEALPDVDPDGSLLQQALREWVDIRIHHNWYLARAAVSMWFASRGSQAGVDEILDLMRRGPFWRDYYTYCQRYLPNWIGVERLVRRDLEGSSIERRLYAGVTLLSYHRIYGVGDDLLKKHGRALRDTILEAKAALVPNMNDSNASMPGGQTILGLALLDDSDAKRVLARMRLLDYPYLSRVLENARFWTGLDPWSKAKFDTRQYEHWYPEDHEIYFHGVMMRYAELVRSARKETDPVKKLKLDEQVKELAVLVETATFFRMTSVNIYARRVKAAIFPEQSTAIHLELIDQGGLESLYGAMVLPLEERIPILLPAITAPSPDNASLAVVGMLAMDAPVPTQMPVATE